MAQEVLHGEASSGASRSQVARESGIHPNVLKDWPCSLLLRKWEAKPGAELKTEQQKGIERLRKENASLRSVLRKGIQVRLRHHATQADLAAHRDVPAARGVEIRIPCVARASSECTRR